MWVKRKINGIVNRQRQDRLHVQYGHTCGWLYCQIYMWIYLLLESNTMGIDLDNILFW